MVKFVLKKIFFNHSIYVTVSIQLSPKVAAMQLVTISTFGSAFRAGNCNTIRHIAEFWMVEPEVEFSYPDDDIVLTEKRCENS